MNGDYPIHLWNHFTNNGPRTNNHVEGDNKKIDSEMPSANMNIYQYIDFIKILEAEVFIDYERREHSFTQNAVPSMFSVMQKFKF